MMAKNKFDPFKPLEKIIDLKDRIEDKIDTFEKRVVSNVPAQVLFGTNHKTLPQAIMADLIDAIPIIGEATNITRIRNADSKTRKTMQSIDLAVDVIPFADLFLPTNSLLLIEKKIKEKNMAGIEK